ncbi:MAG: orotidine-5'-phosphate decarboxylase [Proteobacteria bacterium]|nr:orotidine-5'-phosphate decarboxylase [Pseudomonadota bacterium]
MVANPRIIVALDFEDIISAEKLVAELDPKLCCLKVGKEMFTRFGSAFVKKLIQQGYPVFLDLKFHDIPNTVAKACLAAADLGVWMLNVHASGGRAMLTAAREAIDKYAGNKPLLIAVTVLTSIGEQDLHEVGVQGTIDAQVHRLADLTFQCGFNGVVCSAQEAPMLKKAYGKNFYCVTPGIRLEDSKADDQKRVLTPVQAIEAGADYLVIGRPITQSKNPLEVLKKIKLDIAPFIV